MRDNNRLVDVPITTDIPMLRDNEIYKVYIVLKNDKYSIIEIKAVSKVCGINYIEAKNKLKNKKNLIIQGNAYEVMKALRILSQYKVVFEVNPPFIYSLNNNTIK